MQFLPYCKTGLKRNNVFLLIQLTTLTIDTIPTYVLQHLFLHLCFCAFETVTVILLYIGVVSVIYYNDTSIKHGIHEH